MYSRNPSFSFFNILFSSLKIWRSFFWVKYFFRKILFYFQSLDFHCFTGHRIKSACSPYQAKNNTDKQGCKSPSWACQKMKCQRLCLFGCISLHIFPFHGTSSFRTSLVNCKAVLIESIKS